MATEKNVDMMDDMSVSLELPEVLAWDSADDGVLSDIPGSAAEKRMETSRHSTKKSRNYQQQDDNASAVSVKDTMLYHIMSIHAVLGFLLFSAIGVSVLASELLGSTACDKALDHWQGTSDLSTSLLENSATKSLDMIGSELLGFAAVGVTEGIRGYIASGFTSAKGLRLLVTEHLSGVELRTENWWDTAAKHLWAQAAQLDESSPVVVTSLIAHGRELFYYVASTRPRVNGTSLITHVFLDDFNSSNSVMGTAEPGTGLLYTGNPEKYPFKRSMCFFSLPLKD